MTSSDNIEVGDVDGSKWVRVNGKGSFMSSPRVKEYVEDCLEGGCEEVVVDLDVCPAMDSTFMGTLAGLALKLQQRKGHLTVVGLSERNRDSLVDLGLDAILDLEGEDGASEWDGRMGEIREGLQPWSAEASGAAAAEEVLEAHRKLCDVDQRNEEKFGSVLEVLEKECASS
ncbi:MAG: STAS domain-containing protein [Verrucomicrobiota bacterium]